MARWVIEQGQTWRHANGEEREVVAVSAAEPAIVAWRRPGRQDVEGVAPLTEWQSWMRESDLMDVPASAELQSCEEDSGAVKQNLQAIVAARDAAEERPYSGPSVVIERSGEMTRYALGDRTWDLGPTADFFRFLRHYLHDTVGKEWLQRRRSKCNASTMPLVRLMYEATVQGRIAHEHMKQIGSSRRIFCCAARELYTLSNDLVALDLINALPSAILKRLQSRKYQGARYEVAVAAGFARAGFKVQWLTEEKTVEFIATLSSTDESIAVEAKSRHRGIVFGVDMAPHALQALEADIRKLYQRACQKRAQALPLAIFIDAQVPFRSRVDAAGPLLRLKGLKDSLERVHYPSEESPAREFMLALTSGGWYFRPRQPAPPIERVTTYPVWTRRKPNLVATYVGLSDALRQMYLIPQADDQKVRIDPDSAIGKHLGRIYGDPD
ncbi:MAG: hypothetical protein KAS72_07355 [Phycisphaerales bacterium]|nr:hypothetical protein [Phycisphaerales bacterium]